MHFLSTLEWVDPLWLMILGALTLPLIAGSSTILSLPREKRKQFSPREKRVAVIFYSLTAILVVTSIFLLVNYVVESNQNTVAMKNNLENNLKQKYDFRSVDFDEKDYNAADISRVVSPGKSEPQTIIIVTNDNKKAAFILNQNWKTFEPNLSELSPNSPVSLSSITRH